ncbi:hypothetical protein [Terrimonas alba]|uniref:hypothetical protein n=1 Tax=Terrimonas alba TaxID=3349636 RepID=UPI0035F27ECA
MSHKNWFYLTIATITSINKPRGAGASSVEEDAISQPVILLKKGRLWSYVPNIEEFFTAAGLDKMTTKNAGQPGIV